MLEGIKAGLVDVFGLLLPHLDERQQRLALGAAARVLGHGGIRAVAGAAGVAESTVSRGKRELERGEEPEGRVRAPGAGRKPLREADSELVPALLALVEPDQRGDPESPLLWTVKSTRNLAAELTRQGHRVGSDTVAMLLKAEGFSLQGTSRTTEGARHPDRDAQFHYINDQVKAYLADGQPVISVDAKKKESAPRGALSYPWLSREEFGGIFLGLMAYLDPKGKGDSSMPEKWWPRPGTRSGVPRGPSDMVKALLPETQSPEDATFRPSETYLKPAPHHAS